MTQSVLCLCSVVLIQREYGMTRYACIVICTFLLLLLEACANSALAPVAQRDEVKQGKPVVTQRGRMRSAAEKPLKTIPADGYTVVKGDTLYAIAWRYNLDHKTVANWNNISAPYTIYPGQLVRLNPPPIDRGIVRNIKSKNARSSVSPSPKAESTARKPTRKTETVTAKPTTEIPAQGGAIKWLWPTSGRLVKSSSPTSKKGIDISGKPGQKVKAAAAGQVVYSGSGLLNYGKLVIIKHSEKYLSAYAYNSKLLVKEGDRVNIGQVISIMGRDHKGRHVLHFEIRRNGKPVDPKRYLPGRRA